jgi:uncharacterized membrane protein
MLDSSLQQTGTKIAESEETLERNRRRHKRHRVRQQKRAERFWKKALVVFLYVFTIFLVLSIWYALLKS